MAPAGYGTTTILMSLAIKISKERIPTFYLKLGKKLNSGDISFAIDLFPNDRIIFFIDDAAEHAHELRLILDRLNIGKNSVLFILGERLNEWRQQNRSPRGPEFHIEPLSDAEIKRLLDYLEKHNRLNQLSELTWDERFAVVKQKNEQELLVNMKEVTEGKRFDDILMDEYYGIGDDTTRKAYLIVCCFYQFGVHIRDFVLANILGVDLLDLLKQIELHTAGIIRFDTLSNHRGIHGMRARHRTIAKTIWYTVPKTDKEDYFRLALDQLNLSYYVDKNAFDKFVRSDDQIDEISTLEGRINFFGKAISKEPNNPYIKQHFARMFLRAKQPRLALREIDEAIEINPDIRILYHTKGEILKGIVSQTENNSMARKYRSDAEVNYRKCISMSPRDDYGYQGLAELYFDWVKRRDVDGDEESEFLALAEETISSGLAKVFERDSLWIVSAKIREWLRDDINRIKSLEKAVHSRPTSTIARYLLGRAYRDTEQYHEAIEILEPVITSDFTAFRVFTEYAICILRVGQSYNRAIAVLEQAHLDGMRDPRYVAILGGLYFLNMDFDNAERVWNDARNRNFAYSEQIRIQFYPRNPDTLTEQFTIESIVVSVHPGYSFLSSDKYSDIFCPKSIYDGSPIVAGMRFKHELVFTARGAQADEIEIINP